MLVIVPGNTLEMITLEMIRVIARSETEQAWIDKHGLLEIDAIPRPQPMEVPE